MSTGSRSGSFSILVTRYYGQEVARRERKTRRDKHRTNSMRASQDRLGYPIECACSSKLDNKTLLQNHNNLIK